MSRYYNPTTNWHPSKRSAFRHECSVCGKPMRRSTKNKIGCLCKKCATRIHAFREGNSCLACVFEIECSERVHLGIWVRCETPDIADLERLRSNGGLNDERIRSMVEATLAGKGQRKILEEAISQSTQALYQSFIEGRQGKVPVVL